jgi:hypothetical protein
MNTLFLKCPICGDILKRDTKHPIFTPYEDSHGNFYVRFVGTTKMTDTDWLCNHEPEFAFRPNGDIDMVSNRSTKVVHTIESVSGWLRSLNDKQRALVKKAFE